MVGGGAGTRGRLSFFFSRSLVTEIGAGNGTAAAAAAAELEDDDEMLIGVVFVIECSPLRFLSLVSSLFSRSGFLIRGFDSARAFGDLACESI